MCCFWFWKVLDANKLISNMSHNANGLTIAIIAKIKEDFYRSVIPSVERLCFQCLAGSQKQRNNRTFVIELALIL
jgi:hypothetical protein